VLAAGFVLERCEACHAEYLLAFSCRTRYFRPSCHARRLAGWTVWSGEELLADAFRGDISPAGAP
jgi:hypothetical protein